MSHMCDMLGVLPLIDDILELPNLPNLSSNPLSCDRSHVSVNRLISAEEHLENTKSLAGNKVSKRDTFERMVSKARWVRSLVRV